MIVVDTGPLYAAVDASDAHHRACSALFANPPDRLLVPVSVLIETSFLIERHLGPAAEAAFLGSLAAGLAVEQLTEGDLGRMAELVNTYADMPLGAVDASVVAIAERVGATRSSAWIVATSPWCVRGMPRRSRSCLDRGLRLRLER
ncbi:MAG TPA: PIN domain-containing protein [Gaiellaceae bacterium]|nr:PIN domain-containing protein [Gaiellaceae bacterium]